MKFKTDVIFTVLIVLIAWDVLGIGGMISGMFGGLLSGPSVSQ
jgi:hypothetical protein